VDSRNLIIRIRDLTKKEDHIVGKKCANLGELYQVGFPVPPGFAMTLEAYKEFMKGSGALEEIRGHLESFSGDAKDIQDLQKFKVLSKSLRGIMESKAIPEVLDQLVTDFYSELCEETGIEDVPVATRSAGPVSHPGQYETYLYIRGLADVKAHVKKVWSSTFNIRSLISRARKELPLDYDPIGVAVIQMVNASAAGIMFTADPNTGDPNKIFIEGNWGLGESVVGGNVTPDRWVVNKKTFEIIVSKASVKNREYVLDPEKDKVAMCELPPERKEKFCLSDEQVKRLGVLGTAIEKHFGRAQDIEWALNAEPPDDFYVLQTRPEKFNISINISGF